MFMDDLNNHEINRFAFFIKSTRELPQDYFKIANGLNKYKITLLPISIDEFFQIKTTSAKFCFILNNSLESKVFVDKFRSKYFKLSLLIGSCTLVEISSFEAPEFVKVTQAKTKYFHFWLPEKLSLVCKKLAVLYYRDLLKKENWPGGKRAKLPNDITKKTLHE